MTTQIASAARSSPRSSASVRMDRRFEGPRGHANGGFACGTFAALAGGTARVRLARKVPLGVDLQVAASAASADAVEVAYGGRVLATVQPADPFVLEPPTVPTLDEAAEARLRHPFRSSRHPLSGCVVCGPRGLDGLGVTPGPLDAAPDVLAAPFVPTRAFAGEDGQVLEAAVWGALDCPSYPAAAMRRGELRLLGSLEGHVVRPVHTGERLVVVGWTIGSGDRSTRTASAIIDEEGAVVASARAVWVRLRHERLIRLLARLSR